MSEKLTIEKLWIQGEFKPNTAQKEAILHTDGALYLTAGPGSGKTRVLLWRTVNLIVFHDVKPEEILLTTFTQKAAHQLREGLEYILGIASNYTDTQYDLGKMYIGTLHSICNKLMRDRKFLDNKKSCLISVMDELEQYFLVKRRSVWERLLEAGDIETIDVNAYFQKTLPKFPRKHDAVKEIIAIFNRFSEERIDIIKALKETDKTISLSSILKMYKEYLDILGEKKKCDLSLLQEKAFTVIDKSKTASKIFKHIIVDEYQDTNLIQEDIYFALAGNKNICVVGDDDQSLYRFRGSTVENFVEFPARVKDKLGIEHKRISLSTNYRSDNQIVDFYTKFITKENWTKGNNEEEQYRVFDKNIKANSKDKNNSVVYINGDWQKNVALFCKKLIKEKIVKDPNQIAFLFPSVKNANAKETINQLKEQGLNVYAPRAGNFLYENEPTEIFGVFANIFGLSISNDFSGRDWDEYTPWINRAELAGQEIIDNDKALQNFVKDKKLELETIVNDYQLLVEVADQNNWELTNEYNIDLMKEKLLNANGISPKAISAISSKQIDKLVWARQQGDNPKPVKLSQVINRATSLDWNLLDLFYHLTAFEHFKEYLTLNFIKKDEAPIWNLSKITQYISKFMELYSGIITGQFIQDDGFSRLLFSGYLYGIFRLKQGESENDDDPFPSGNIQVLTIHQAKGLEFPVVFIYPKRQEFKTDIKEQTIRQLKSNGNKEPEHRISRFDNMRMFYVGLSRPEKLLMIPVLEEKRNGKEVVKYMNDTIKDSKAVHLDDFDTSNLEINKSEQSTLTKIYSYTADYTFYKECPRRYMMFRKYGFVPSRRQAMLFGTLIHDTIEDIHQHLITEKANSNVNQ